LCDAARYNYHLNHLCSQMDHVLLVTAVPFIRVYISTRLNLTQLLDERFFFPQNLEVGDLYKDHGGYDG
jgi:hypothetical protein